MRKIATRKNINDQRELSPDTIGGATIEYERKRMEEPKVKPGKQSKGKRWTAEKGNPDKGDFSELAREQYSETPSPERRSGKKQRSV